MMADYITLATMATTLNTALNTLSGTLNTAGDISREIPFNVVEDIQDYEDTKVYSSTVTVPGIMQRLDGNVNPSQVYQQYQDIVLVSIYAFKRELDDVLKVIDEYVQANTGKFTRTTDWVYQMSFKRPTIIDRGVDEGEERVTVALEITYQYIYKGFTSDDVTVKINTVEVPVINYTSKVTKTLKSAPRINASGVIKHKAINTSIQRSITFIHIDNTTLNQVVEDIDSGNLNRTYSIYYGYGTTYSNTETMIILEGDIQVAEGGFQIVNVTFGIYYDV